MTGPVPESLTDPSLAPLWIAVRDRLQRRGLRARGRLRVPPLERRGRMLLDSLVDRGRATATIDLDALEAPLVRMGVGRDLAEVVGALGFPIDESFEVRRTNRQRAQAARHAARDEAGRWPEAWAADWIDEVIRVGLLRDLGPDDALDLVTKARAVLDHLAATRESSDRPAASRTEVAAAVLGSAHALDPGQRVEAAVTRALTRMVAAFDREDDDRDVWERAGAHADLVSGAVLTWRLPVRAGSPLAALVGAASELDLPIHLTQMALRRHPVDVEPGVEVLVVENPRVVEAAAQRRVEQPMVCTNGNPSVAGRLLLGQLVAAGAQVRYHGDFDAAGLAICRRMTGLGLVPWRMTAGDYFAALEAADSDGVVLPLDDRAPGPTPWDPELEPTFAAERRIVHEERLLDDLLG